MVLVSCIFSYFLPNQNNPTVVWLRCTVKKTCYVEFLQMNSSNADNRWFFPPSINSSEWEKMKDKNS